MAQIFVTDNTPSTQENKMLKIYEIQFNCNNLGQDRCNDFVFLLLYTLLYSVAWFPGVLRTGHTEMYQQVPWEAKMSCAG